jgi:ribosomal protein S27E
MSDEQPEPAPVLLGYFRIGRVYCGACNHYAAVVSDAEVTVVTCPSCGEPCTSSNGPDDMR